MPNRINVSIVSCHAFSRQCSDTDGEAAVPNRSLMLHCTRVQPAAPLLMALL